MKATEFEFRYRFWVLAAIYTLGFWCYSFDHVNVVQALLERILGHSLRSASDRYLLQGLFALGAGVVVLAALVRTWAAAYLKSEVVHDPNLHADRLVADGPYRYVRNPLYVGGILLSIGFGLLASRPGFLVIVIGNTLFYYRLIRREEAALLETQGESYRRFLAAVPRLVPSLTPRLPSGGRTPHWAQGFVGETFMWLFALCIAAFAATLNQVFLYATFGVAFGGYAIAMIVLRRIRKKEPATARPGP